MELEDGNVEGGKSLSWLQNSKEARFIDLLMGLNVCFMGVEFDLKVCSEFYGIFRSWERIEVLS